MLLCGRAHGASKHCAAASGCVCIHITPNGVKLTFGVKRYVNPSVAPSKVRPRIRKIVRTRYGKVAVTYTAWNSETITSLTFLGQLHARSTHLSNGVDASDEADVHHTPGGGETHHQPPLEGPAGLDVWGDVQGVAVPKVIHGRALFALLIVACWGVWTSKLLYSFHVLIKKPLTLLLERN